MNQFIHQPSASRRHLRLGSGRGGRLPSRAGPRLNTQRYSKNEFVILPEPKVFLIIGIRTARPGCTTLNTKNETIAMLADLSFLMF